MKIVYDHQIFSRVKYGGISKYFVELWKNLDRNENFSYELVCKFSNNENLLELDNNEVPTFFKRHGFKGKNKILTSINDFYAKQKLSRTSMDVFHPTYYDPYFLSHISKTPVVVTCYDLIHEKFSEKFPILKKDNPAGKRKILEKSDQIIAISETTKKDIVECYGISPEKIKVIYLSHDQIFKEKDFVETSLPEKYLLFVGVRSAYKNFLFFIETICAVLKKYPGLKVLCAGGGEFSDEELQLFHRLGIEDRVVFHKINSRNLAFIYSNALAFFFPSLYEGFGIPVLEAFCNNCPAVLSNQGSLPEVAQDGAMYFDPYERDSLLEAAFSIIEDDSKRKALTEKGNNRLQFFSWEKTAAQTFDLYQSLI